MRVPKTTPQRPPYPSSQCVSPGLAAAHGGGYDSEGSFAGSAAGPGERLLGKRVLIVEDEALLALELQFAFQDEGADVLGPAMSLESAIAIVAGGGEIDVAVLDVDIAGQEVFPVAALLQQRGVPIVFHTGHFSRLELGAMFPGAITCTKPAMPDTLVLHLLRLGR